jgi:hypothetical protein
MKNAMLILALASTFAYSFSLFTKAVHKLLNRIQYFRTLKRDCDFYANQTHDLIKLNKALAEQRDRMRVDLTMYEGTCAELIAEINELQRDQDAKRWANNYSEHSF